MAAVLIANKVLVRKGETVRCTIEDPDNNDATFSNFQASATGGAFISPQGLTFQDWRPPVLSGFAVNDYTLSITADASYGGTVTVSLTVTAVGDEGFLSPADGALLVSDQATTLLIARYVVPGERGELDSDDYFSINPVNSAEIPLDASSFSITDGTHGSGGLWSVSWSPGQHQAGPIDLSFKENRTGAPDNTVFDINITAINAGIDPTTSTVDALGTGLFSVPQIPPKTTMTISWSVSGGGTIETGSRLEEGRFLAGYAPGTWTVTAVQTVGANSIMSTAQVTVEAVTTSITVNEDEIQVGRKYDDALTLTVSPSSIPRSDYVVQWYITPPGGDETPVGGDGLTLGLEYPANATLGTRNVRARITFPEGTYVDATASFEVVAGGPSVDVSAVKTTLFTGEGTTVTATPFNITTPHYTWSATGGTVPSGNVASGTYTAPSKAGSYTVKCDVRDGAASGPIVATDDIEITVEDRPNRPPTVSVTSSAATVAPGGTVTVTATASDPDGTVASYKWESRYGTFADDTAASTTWTAPSDNVRVDVPLTCTVTDDDGATAEASVTVTVTPTGNVSVSITVPSGDIETGKTYALTAVAATTTPGATITGYEWTAVLGVLDSTTAKTVNWTAPQVEGSTTVGVKATDSAGGEASAIVVLNVIKAKVVEPFEVTATGSSSSGEAEDEIALSASFTPSDATVLTWQWSVTGGTLDSTSKQSVTWTLPDVSSGKYTATVTAVTDDDKTASDTWEVEVSPGTIPNRPPILSIVSADKYVAVGSSTQLTATASDLDGDTFTYLWTADDGTLSDPTIANPTWTPTKAGKVQITCIVREDKHEPSGVTPRLFTVRVLIVYGYIGQKPAPSPIDDLLPPNAGPKVVVATSGTRVAIGGTVNLTATATDEDGTIIDYLWRATGGSLSSSNTSSTVWTAPTAPGRYEISCRVTDDDGAFSSSYVLIVVLLSINALPTVSISADTVKVKQGGMVNLVATAADPDGSIASYRWYALAGAFSDESIYNPVWTAPFVPGVFDLGCAVTDNEGAQNFNLIAVEVLPPLPPETEVRPLAISSDQLVLAGDRLVLPGGEPTFRTTILIKGEVVRSIENGFTISHSMDTRGQATLQVTTFLSEVEGLAIARNDEVLVYDNRERGRLLFGGYINEIDQTVISAEVVSLTMSCVDFSGRLDSIIIDNKQGAVVQRLATPHDQFVALIRIVGGEGFYRGALVRGAQAISQDIRQQTVATALRQLAGDSGAAVSVDAAKRISITAKAGARDSGVTVGGSAGEEVVDISRDVDSQNLANRVTVIGSPAQSNIRYRGDGATRSFPLEGVTTLRFYDLFDANNIVVRPRPKGDPLDVSIRGEFPSLTLQLTDVWEDEVVGGGAVSGVVWKFKRPFTIESGNITVSAYNYAPAKSDQIIDPSYFTGTPVDPKVGVYYIAAADGAIYLNFYTQGQTNPGIAGPQLTDTAESNLGLAFRAADGTTLKRTIAELEPYDTTEPYQWVSLPSNLRIPAEFITKMRTGGLQAAILDRNNRFVKWDTLDVITAFVLLPEADNNEVYDEDVVKTLKQAEIVDQNMEISLVDGETWSQHALNYSAYIRHNESGKTWAVDMTARDGSKLSGPVSDDTITQILQRVTTGVLASFSMLILDRTVRGIDLPRHRFYPDQDANTPIIVTEVVNPVRVNDEEQVLGFGGEWVFHEQQQELEHVALRSLTPRDVLNIGIIGNFYVIEDDGIGPFIDKVVRRPTITSSSVARRLAKAVIDVFGKPIESLSVTLKPTPDLHMESGTLVRVSSELAALAGVEQPEDDEQWLCTDVQIATNGDLVNYTLTLLRRGFQSRSREFWLDALEESFK